MKTHIEAMSDNESPRTLAPPVMKGLLYKKRGGFGKMMLSPWVHRYCELSPSGILNYFETENSNPVSLAVLFMTITVS